METVIGREQSDKDRLENCCFICRRPKSDDWLPVENMQHDRYGPISLCRICWRKCDGYQLKSGRGWTACLDYLRKRLYELRVRRAGISFQQARRVVKGGEVINGFDRDRFEAIPWPRQPPGMSRHA